MLGSKTAVVEGILLSNSEEKIAAEGSKGCNIVVECERLKTVS